MSYEEIIRQNRKLQEELDSANAIIEELRDQITNYERNNNGLTIMKNGLLQRIHQVRKENEEYEKQIEAMQAEFEEVVNDILMPTEDQ